MIERTIVLPLANNEGKSNGKALEKIKTAILSIAGGFSESLQVGYWKDDDGKVYRDKSLRVTTTVDETQDTQILDLLPVWCESLEQVCLYTHVVEVQPTFVYPLVKTA